MPDIHLYQGEPSPTNVKLANPTARRFTYTITADAGLYNWVGTPTFFAVLRSVVLYAGEASATDIRLRGNITGGAFTLTAVTGAYTLSGTAATLTAGRLVPATAGSYAWTGTTATLKAGRYVSANAGSYLEFGTAATLKAGRYLGATSGTFSVVGTVATLKASFILGANTGSYSESGTNATLFAGRYVSGVAGTYILTGTNATLTQGGGGHNTTIFRTLLGVG